MFLWNGDSGLGIGDSEDRVRACFGSRGEATAAVAVAFRQSRIPNPQSRRFVLLPHRQEGLLRDLHAADLLHPLLAFLLLLPQSFLPPYIATLPLAMHLLALRLYRVPGASPPTHVHLNPSVHTSPRDISSQPP